MKISVFFRGRKILIDVHETGFISRGFGLTFRTRETKNLLFDFKKYVTWQGTLTSVFVFFPFLTLWLDSRNKVIDFAVVKPFVFSISQNKPFSRIVEIPLNLSNMPVIGKFIDKKEFFKHFRR